MRKRLFIYVFIVGLLSLCFIACEKNSEDILKGTWMSEDWNSSATAEEIYDVMRKYNVGFLLNEK